MCNSFVCSDRTLARWFTCSTIIWIELSVTSIFAYCNFIFELMFEVDVFGSVMNPMFYAQNYVFAYLTSSWHDDLHSSACLQYMRQWEHKCALCNLFVCSDRTLARWFSCWTIFWIDFSVTSIFVYCNCIFELMFEVDVFVK